MQDSLLSKKIRILIIEDDDSQSILIYEVLTKSGFECIIAENAARAIEIYSAASDYLILLDYHLPDLNGFELLEKLISINSTTNFIIMTAFGNEKIAVEMMKKGARDYIVKDNNFIGLLPNVINRVVENIYNEKALIESQNQLKDAEKRYQELFDQSTEAIYYSSAEGKIIDCNKAMLELFGYEYDEIKGISSIILYKNQSDRDLFRKECDSKGYFKDFEVDLLHKSGKVLNCILNSYARKDSEGKVIGYQGLILDISKIREVEKSLFESEKKYRSLFEHVPVGIYRTDCEGKIIDANPAILKIMGVSSIDELKKYRTEDFYTDEHARERWYELMSKNAIVSDFESKMRRADGEEIWVLDSSRMLEEDGQVYFEGVIVDLSENKRIQDKNEKLIEELKESKRQVEELNDEILELNYDLIANAEELKKTNASKDKLFSIISHDLKNPLSGFVGLTDILSKEIEQLGKEEIKQMAEAMNISSRQIYELLINLLEWSRLQGGNLSIQNTKINLKQTINYSIKLFTDVTINKGLEIICNVNDDLYVDADKHSLNSVLRNLISNAIKFSYPNNLIEINALKFDNRIEISIKDFGKGIKEEDKPKLFKLESSFSTLGTLNEKGTGLGLVLAKELVEKMNGSLILDSEESKGTNARVLLQEFLD